MSGNKQAGPQRVVASGMDRRSDERIEMQLPCRVDFPLVWRNALQGLTGNLHRNGLLVTCQLIPGSEVPAIGSSATVQIKLPTSDQFPQKCMLCDTTLIRVDQLGNEKFQFAMRILSVDFQDVVLTEREVEISSYVM